MKSQKVSTIKVKPFLRWAGGKRWLKKHLDSFLPDKFNNYIEPFLGGGSIYYYLVNSNRINNKAILSDFNPELINVYRQVRDNVEPVIAILSHYTNSEECYYLIREMEPTCKITQAARFIYLNQTSFNGIFRVNKSGKYNVPFGKRNNSVDKYCNYQNLRKVSKVLRRKASFRHGDFELKVKRYAGESDLVFLDPPYTVAHEDNGFIQYNQKIFSWEDQTRLADLLEHINEVNAYYIMTNAAHISISELFSPYGKKHIVERQCNIGGVGAKRSTVHEYIYTNIGE
jgi:DNA adenine methylase